MVNKTRKMKLKLKNSEKTELEILKSIGRRSSRSAILESRVLGLTIKLIKNHKLIEKLPNGVENIIRKIDPVSISSLPTLKKGTILCRKTKKD